MESRGSGPCRARLRPAPGRPSIPRHWLTSFRRRVGLPLRTAEAGDLGRSLHSIAARQNLAGDPRQGRIAAGARAPTAATEDVCATAGEAPQVKP